MSPQIFLKRLEGSNSSYLFLQMRIAKFFLSGHGTWNHHAGSDSTWFTRTRTAYRPLASPVGGVKVMLAPPPPTLKKPAGGTPPVDFKGIVSSSASVAP